MNRFLLPVLAGLLSSITALPAAAWGVQGHALVAEVAQTRLDPEVGAEVAALLGLEGHQHMAQVASWADQLRERDPDLGRRSARWHYINLAEQGLEAAANCQYQPAQHCADGNCVVAALQSQAGILADRRLPAVQRLQALKFVIHFAGDVHQPMHAGYGHDKGGNTVQVQHEGRGSNLHALWDSGMLRSRNKDNPAYLAHLLALPAPQLAVGQIPAWAENSCRIAIAEGVYPAQRVIEADYVARHLPTAEAQLRLAGEHLADLLNRTLAAAATP